MYVHNPWASNHALYSCSRPLREMIIFLFNKQQRGWWHRTVSTTRFRRWFVVAPLLVYKRRRSLVEKSLGVSLLESTGALLILLGRPWHVAQDTLRHGQVRWVPHVNALQFVIGLFSGVYVVYIYIYMYIYIHTYIQSISVLYHDITMIIVHLLAPK